MTEVTNLVMEDLKAQIKAKGSQKAVADDLDITPAYLADILSGRRNLSDNVLAKLGYERVTVHVKTSDAQRVVEAIEAAIEKSAAHLPLPTTEPRQGASQKKRSVAERREPVAA